jgi:hypothetical protein
MKRRLLKLAVFLLLGAIINVAVAWGCASQWESKSSIGLTDRSYYSQHSAHNEFSAGLPLRSLTGRRGSALWSGEEIDGFWIIPRSRPNWDVFLPISPIWSGFAINTLFYAAILWLLFAAPFALRRWRRVRRGLCPAGAYPVGVSAVCTECGAAVTPKLKAEIETAAGNAAARSVI